MTGSVFAALLALAQDIERQWSGSSKVETEEFHRVLTVEDWTRLWERCTGHAKAPDVDFKKSMIVAILTGRAGVSTGLNVKSVRETPGGRVVTIEQYKGDSPHDGAGVYLILKLKRLGGKLTLVWAMGDSEKVVKEFDGETTRPILPRLAAAGKSLEQFQESLGAIAGHKAAAARLEQEAHAALDRSDYEAAVGKHKEAASLKNKVKEIKGTADRRAVDIATAILPLLDSDEYEERERTTIILESLNDAVLPALEGARRGAGPEVATRLDRVIRKLREEKSLRQWAAEATASSEYSKPDWGAIQATGAPNTMQGGDARTAWAPKSVGSGEEWLELSYARWVHPTSVRVCETNSPGAVVKIEAKDRGGEWHVLWAGKDPTAEVPGWLVISAEPQTWAARTIRVTLNTKLVSGWSEIDAVELLGEPE